MASETETPTARVPSRETLATRAFGKVVRARKELEEARASFKKATFRHSKRISEKQAAIKAAEKALAEFLPDQEEARAEDPPQD